MAQAGLGQDSSITMRDRSEMFRDLLNQGHSSTSASAQLDAMGIPSPNTQVAAGLTDDQPEAFSRGGLLSYGAQLGAEAIVGGAADFLADQTGYEGFSTAGDYLSDLVGPSEKRDEKAQLRAQERQDRVDAGELGAAGAFAGEALDAIVQEIPTFAAQIGATALTKSAVPALAIGAARVRDETRERAKLEKAKEQFGEAPTQEQIDSVKLSKNEIAKVDAVSALQVLPETLVPLKIAKRIGGDAVTSGIQNAAKKALKEGAKDGAMEGAMEVAQLFIQEAAYNKELQAKIKETSTPEEMVELAEHIAREHGREAALGFVAGVGLGGPAGGATAGMQQSRTNTQEKQNAATLADVAKGSGLTAADLETQAKDPEKAAIIREAAPEIQSAERGVTSAEETLLQAQQNPDDASLIPELEQRVEAAKLKRDQVHDKYIPKLGGQDSATIKKGVQEENNRKTAEATERLGKLNVKTPKVKDIPEGELPAFYDAAADLETKARERQNLSDTLSRVPDKKGKKRKQYEEALEAEADAVAAFEARYNSADPVQARSEFIKARKTEEAAIQAGAEMDPKKATQLARIERDYPDPEKRRAYLENYLKKAAKKKPDAKIEADLKKAQRAYTKAMNDPSTDTADLDRLDKQIEGLKGQLGTVNPAVMAAEEALQALDQGSDAQSLPQGGEAVQTPSDDKAGKAKSQPEVAPKAAEAKPEAAEGSKGPVTAQSPSAAAQPKNISPDTANDLKNARANFKKNPDDPEAEAQADGAATRALEEAGVKNPSSRQVSEVISGGGTVAQRVKRAAAMATAAPEAAPAPAQAAAGLDATPVPAEDPRRQGGDVGRQYRWSTLIDDIDPDAGMEAHEAFLRDWTKDNGFEASATYDADGALLGIGTNRNGNQIAMPTNGWNQPNVTMTHTHPQQTPMSSADVMVLAQMNPEGTSVRAVLPDGQVTEIIRGQNELTPALVRAEFSKLRDALDETIPAGLGLTAAARIKQEAFLRHMDAEGYIEYAQPMSGFSSTEENVINGAIDAAASDTGIRDDAGAGTPTPEGRRDGAAGAAVAPEGPGAAAGLDLARTADQDPLPGQPADPQRIADLTQPFVDMVNTFPKTTTGKINTSNLNAFEKAVANGDLTQAGMNAGLSYAANAVSTEGTEASTVVLQAARLMFPKAKMTPSTFTKKKVTRKNGKKSVDLILNDDWKNRMNVAFQFLNRVGQAEGMGFESIKLPMKQKNGFWDFDATHFTMPQAMTDYLQMSPPQSALFTRPMEDPTDTTDIVRNVDTNVFTPEAIDRMRKTAEYMQANTYYLDQDAIAALTPDDLISDKKLGEQLLKRNDDGVFVDKNGTPVDDLPQQPTRDGSMTDHPQKKFIKTQRYRQSKKLAMLRRMAEIHGDQPLGYRYRVDDKGRIYADGAFTPQTGDYVKGILRVGEPNGPKLKDMPMVDHSASGWQVATLMTKDAEAANWFNLGARPGEQTLATQEGYKKRDMYDQLMTDLKAEIINDAQNHPSEKTRKLATLFKERVFDTGMPFGKVQIKPAVIAVNYAGGRANFQERLMDVYGDQFKDVPAADRAGLWGYTSGAAYDQLRAKAPDTMKFQDWAIEKLASLITQVEGNKNALKAKPDLQFSVGLDGTYAKIKPISKEVKVKAVDGSANSVEQTVDVPTEVVDANATARSIYSQIIQGFDASILHRAMDIYKQNGDDFVTSNHDSYTTPQGQAGRMAAATREAMKQVMTEVGDAPGRLRAEIEAQAAEYGVTIEELNNPEIFNEDGSFKAGDYDLNDLDTAVPVFVENAGDVAPALTDLQGNVLPDAPAFEPIARGIDYEASDTGAETGVQMDTSLPKAAQYAQDNQFQTGRDFKAELQSQALAAQAREGIDLTQDTPENIERLADFVVEDAKAAVVNNRNAIGWYGRTVDAAKAELRKLHPELTPGSDAEFQFNWALAVTSNGLKVDKNFQLAEQAYRTFKETGSFPTNIGIGEAAQGINQGLGYYQQLVDKLGSVQAARDFMVKRQPVRDIERISGNKVSKEGKGTVLPGAVILGPKIGGGFFSNLYGNFNELTMDRWFTRTVGRWRGTLIKADPANVKLKQGQMRDALRDMAPADLKALRALYDGSGVPIRKTMSAAQLDALAMETAKRSMKPDWRAQINNIPGGETVRKVGNMHAKYLDGQVEDPGGAKNRTYLREVLNRGLDRLRAEPDMSELTMADLQALLWYPEKRLYDTAKKPAGEEVTGYETDEAPDYSTAAAKLVRDRLGQAGRDGAGSEPSGAGAEPSFGPPLANGIDTDAGTDGGGVQRGTGQQQNPAAYGDDGRSGLRSGGISTEADPVAYAGFARTSDGAAYAAAMRRAAEGMGPEAGQVSIVEPDAGVDRYLSDDGLTGYALDGDNIIGVFADPNQKGAAKRILESAVARGGRRLDGFDTFLPKIYARGGFKAVARLPFNPEYAPSIAEGALADWDSSSMEGMGALLGQSGWGSPDVVFMVYDPENASPDTDNTVGDYDDGIREQDRSLEGPAGGTGQAGTGLQQDVGGGTGGSAPIARGIDEWVGAKPGVTDAKIDGEIDRLSKTGRSPNAILTTLRHDPALFSYDRLMNDATRRDGKDYGHEFFDTHSKFSRGLMSKLATLSRGKSPADAAKYLKMADLQKKDHQSKLIDGINRGSIEVADIDPATKTYSLTRDVNAPIAMGMDVTARVKAAPKKNGIAQPVETKTQERVATSLFNGAADPGGTFDKIQQWLGRMGRSTVRNVFDRQAALRQIEALAGMTGASVHDGMAKMAQMLTASTGRVAAMMSFGAPKWNSETKLFEIDRDTKGLEDIFNFKNVEDYQNFQGWAYAKRDRDLMKQGKGARMTDELRAEYESISEADKKRYDDMLTEYKKFNNGLRQLMLDSGLINKKQMDALAKENEYVPMFRQFDDPEQFGLQNVFYGNDGGFSHPDPGIKSLKGDAKKVGEPGGGEFGDLIEGIHNNAVAVMHAASQNLAHAQIYKFMQDNMSHETSKVKPYTLGKKEKKSARGGNDVDAVKFLQNGKEVYWKPKGDPEWTASLHMALAGLRPAQLDGIDRALKSFNGYMRQMVTSTPAFAIRSVIRDGGQAYVQSGTNPLSIAKRNATMLAESWQGYSQETQDLMMASGVGGYQMQGMPEVDAANLRKKVKAQEAGRMHQIRQAFGAYERVLGGTELAARSEVYEGIKARPGQTEADAAYEALNMIDYNRKGASRVVQRLSYMVLFLNPRLQGMYRLFNETSGDNNKKYAGVAASLAARGLVLTGLGIGIRALTAMNEEDEERYRALSVSDRATYFHIPIPGSDRFLRLPKPFEVGAAFATLPVAGLDAIAMGEEGMNDAGMMAAHVFSETFSLNPTPQAVKPIVEVMLNRNMFTGREIEGIRLEGLPKEMRADIQTGGLARALGNKAVSPAQIQHLINGYLGPLGMFGYNAVDATLAGAGLVSDKAAKPEGVFGSLPGLARIPADFTAGWMFSKTDEERGTRHVGNFYDLHSRISQYTAAINEASRMGDVDEVKRLQTKSAQIMPLKKYMNKVNKRLGDLNRAMRVAQLAPNLSDEERQERIAKINIAKNELVRGAMEVARKQGVAGSFLGGALIGDTVGL